MEDGRNGVNVQRNVAEEKDFAKGHTSPQVQDFGVLVVLQETNTNIDTTRLVPQ